MDKISIKTPQDLKKMKEGGEKLRRVKKELQNEVREGKNAQDIEKLAYELIVKEGGNPSFEMVPGYKWATCVNVNEGLVHGIPRREVVFKKGDVVSVDLGMYYKGFHTDTSFTTAIFPTKETAKFLETGKTALKKAIGQARAGGRIFDISRAIEATVESGGYSPIRALVGHGVGKALHEEPQIPCFTHGAREDSPEIKEGMALAIEVMYALGSPEVVMEEDGWTISVRDGKISALYEETVAVGPRGPLVLT